MTTFAASYRAPFKYTDRASKARYTAAKYASILTGRVLDVGCDVKALSTHLPATTTYVGVDMAPTADVVINLDQSPLPFEDRSFDTVVCTDVLEHLDQLHRVFDELCRVSGSRVIVSLPNPYRNLLLLAAEQRSKFRHYGLPTEAPTDRHRWFFGALDAARFIEERSKLNGFVVEHQDVDEHGLPPVRMADGRDLASDPNFNLGTTWAVLVRSSVLGE